MRFKGEVSRFGTNPGDMAAPSALEMRGISREHSPIVGIFMITESQKGKCTNYAINGVSVSGKPKIGTWRARGDVEQRVMVLTYGASEPADQPQPPSREYLNCLLRGARHWGLPAQYIAQLERVKVSS